MRLQPLGMRRRFDYSAEVSAIVPDGALPISRSRPLYSRRGQDPQRLGPAPGAPSPACSYPSGSRSLLPSRMLVSGLDPIAVLTVAQVARWRLLRDSCAELRDGRLARCRSPACRGATLSLTVAVRGRRDRLRSRVIPERRDDELLKFPQVYVQYSLHPFERCVRRQACIRGDRGRPRRARSPAGPRYDGALPSGGDDRSRWRSDGPRR